MDFPSEARTSLSTEPKPHGRRYPWDLWFARLPVVLRRGEDYDVEPASFGINARLAAKARGVGVRVFVTGDSVTIERASTN